MGRQAPAFPTIWLHCSYDFFGNYGSRGGAKKACCWKDHRLFLLDYNRKAMLQRLVDIGCRGYLKDYTSRNKLLNTGFFEITVSRSDTVKGQS